VNSAKTEDLLLKGGDGRTQAAMQSRLLRDYANVNTNLKSLHALPLIPLSKELYDLSPHPTGKIGVNFARFQFRLVLGLSLARGVIPHTLLPCQD